MKLFKVALTCAFVLLSAISYTDEATAQCVNCEARSATPVQPRTSGGGPTCSSGQENERTLEGRVELDASTIKQVSAVHPRFALALAMLSRNEVQVGYARVYFRASNLTSADVEEYLNRAPTAVATSYEDVRRLQNAPVTPETDLVIYEVRLTQGEDSATAAIKLRVIQGAADDPALESLDLDLVQSASGVSQKSWKAAGWRVK
jgi:hypothetical protein